MRPRFIAVLLAAFVALCPVGTSAQRAAVPAGSKVYIAPMTGDLRPGLRAALEKQKVPLTLVASEDDAQFVIAAPEDPEAVSLSNAGGGAISMRIHRTGTITLRSKSDGATLWSEKWELRSLSPKDEQKLAAKLVGSLKKAVRK